MSEPFLAEIRIVGFGFPPRGWANCVGQILPIDQNQALFSLLGTTYGGNGRTTFGLPEMRGRAPIHRSQTHTLGERGGVQSHRLSPSEIPGHSHRIQASGDQATTGDPAGNALAAKARFGSSYYAAQPSEETTLHDNSLSVVGAGVAHENMQPFLALNYVIALQGVFPSRN